MRKEGRQAACLLRICLESVSEWQEGSRLGDNKDAAGKCGEECRKGGKSKRKPRKK